MKTIIEEIDSFCLEQGRYGYTIPYLYKIELDNNREKSIAEILKFLSMQPKAYLITFCNELDEYIIGLHKPEYAPIYMYKNFENLYYDQDKIGELKSLEDLILHMENIYQIRIDNRTFSKNIDSKKWE